MRWLIAVAAAVRYPAKRAEIGHLDAERPAGPRHHRTNERRLRDRLEDGLGKRLLIVVVEIGRPIDEAAAEISNAEDSIEEFRNSIYLAFQPA